MTRIGSARGFKTKASKLSFRAVPLVPFVAYPLNRAAYRRRNAIERMFGHSKNWKRIATRYDRLAVN